MYSEFQTLAEEVEEGLRDIDFLQVTTEDRITFVETAVAWQIRRALACGRFDLALQLERYRKQRIASFLHQVDAASRALLRFPAI